MGAKSGLGATHVGNTLQWSGRGPLLVVFGLDAERSVSSLKDGSKEVVVLVLVCKILRATGRARFRQEVALCR